MRRRCRRQRWIVHKSFVFRRRQGSEVRQVWEVCAFGNNCYEITASLSLSLSLSLCDWFSIHFRAGVVWHQNWTRPKQWNNPSRTDWLAARSRRQNSFSSLANEVVDTPATVPRQLLLSLFPLFHFTRSPFHHHLRLFALSVCVCI